MFVQIHPIIKGVWSLVSAVYQVARAQADLDKSIQDLIQEMAEGCALAKEHAPQRRQRPTIDVIIRDILKEVSRSANIVKVYFEKRSSSTSYLVFDRSFSHFSHPHSSQRFHL